MSQGNGPGFKTPLDAFSSGVKEKLLYVICISPEPEARKQSDYIATVDVDSSSPTYSKVIHRTYVDGIGDELHHFGWNTCSSCFGTNLKRDKIIAPSLGSEAIYIIDTNQQNAPKIIKKIPGEEVRKYGVTALHTTHCLPNGEVMISAMGDADQNGKGDYILLSANTFDIKGLWTNGPTAKFGYDFWYQPYWDVLVASEWGAPRSFRRGFSVEDTQNKDLYGQSLNVYSWSKRILLQTIDLGTDGIAPLEIRFLHNPKASEGYVGCALNANIFRFFRKTDGTWNAEKVIDVPNKKVEGWATPEIAGMISDVVISMDDRYLYFSNWLHGDVRQYDITNTASPKLVGQIFLGGKLLKDSSVKLIHDPDGICPIDPVIIKGSRIYGAPQMLQLSLDGTRLYVTTSLYSPWDKQIYPELAKNGSALIKLHVDINKGGLTIDKDFLADFGKEPGGPVLAHECRFEKCCFCNRYPGGDCTSDIYTVDACCPN